MKKNREMNRYRWVLLYTLLGYYLFIATFSVAMAQDSTEAESSAVEQAILALSDPFVPQIKVVEPEQSLPPSSPLRVVHVEPPVQQYQPPVFAPQVVQPPVVIAPVEAPKLDLTGVIFSSDHSMAIVNGQIVEAGQSIMGVDGKITIRKIEKERIFVVYKGSSFTITVGQGE